MEKTNLDKSKSKKTKSNRPNPFIKVFLFLCGYPMFCFLQIFRLPYCFMRKRAAANRECNRAGILKFPLNGQGIGVLKDMQIGRYNFAHSGCGAIATYNVLSMAGIEPQMEEIVDFYEKKGLICYAGLGINPQAVGRFLRKQGLVAGRYAGRRITDECLKNGQYGILMYWWGTAKGCGAHYVAVERREEKLLVYNEHNLATSAKEYKDLQTFLSGGNYKRAVVLFVIEKC